MNADIKKWIWPYIQLARLDRPIGIWLLLLPAWWALALAGGDFRLFFLFAIGAIVMRSAGCVINDIWDVKFDRQVARTRIRPLAAGTLNKRQAVSFLAILLFIGFIILLQMNNLTIFLGILSLPLIVIYPLMKRFTWWPQAFLGLTFNFGALMGWTAVTGTLALPAFLLYISGIFWTLGYDTIYAHQDKEDDALVGIKSSALRLGRYSQMGVTMFYGLHLFLLALAMINAGEETILLLAPAAHLIWQCWSWKPDETENCLTRFKSNRDYGLLVLAAIILA